MEKNITNYNGFQITIRSEEQGFFAYIKSLSRASTGAGVSMGSDIILGPHNDEDTALAVAKAAIDKKEVW